MYFANPFKREHKLANKLFSNWSFVKRAGKVGALPILLKTATSFQLDEAAFKLKKLLSRLEELTSESKSFAQFVIDEHLDQFATQNFTPEQDEGNFLLSNQINSNESTVDEFSICNNNLSKNLIHVGAGKYLTVNKERFNLYLFSATFKNMSHFDWLKLKSIVINE